MDNKEQSTLKLIHKHEHYLKFRQKNLILTIHALSNSQQILATNQVNNTPDMTMSAISCTQQHSCSTSCNWPSILVCGKGSNRDSRVMLLMTTVMLLEVRWLFNCKVRVKSLRQINKKKSLLNSLSLHASHYLSTAQQNEINSTKIFNQKAGITYVYATLYQYDISNQLRMLIKHSVIQQYEIIIVTTDGNKCTGVNV